MDSPPEDPHLHYGCYGSRDRGPQTHQKKYTGNGADHFRDQTYCQRLFLGLNDPTAKQKEASQPALEQNTCTGPAVRERRE